MSCHTRSVFVCRRGWTPWTIIQPVWGRLSIPRPCVRLGWMPNWFDAQNFSCRDFLNLPTRGREGEMTLTHKSIRMQALWCGGRRAFVRGGKAVTGAFCQGLRSIHLVCRALILASSPMPEFPTSSLSPLAHRTRQCFAHPIARRVVGDIIVARGDGCSGKRGGKKRGKEREIKKIGIRTLESLPNFSQFNRYLLHHQGAVSGTTFFLLVFGTWQGRRWKPPHRSCPIDIFKIFYLKPGDSECRAMAAGSSVDRY